MPFGNLIYSGLTKAQLPSIIVILFVIAVGVLTNLFLQTVKNRDARRIAKANNAVSILHAFEISESTRNLYASFAELEKAKAGALALSDRDSEFAASHRGNIVTLLNHYEFIAVAVEQKALDEKFCRKLFAPNYVHRFRFVEPYVKNARKGIGTFDGRKRPTLYSSYERLAKIWEKSL